MDESIVEERLAFASGPLRLAGVLAYPQEAAPEQAVLMCSPHPHFAGDMNNNVVSAVARRLATHAIVLRFDYRGVGASEIALGPDESVFDYWTDVEETKDYTGAVEDVRSAAQVLLDATGALNLEPAVVGYSFGAATSMLFGHADGRVQEMVGIAPPLGKVSFGFLAGCSKPSLHMVGTKDFRYSQDKMEAFRMVLGPAGQVVVLDEADHFFRGDGPPLPQSHLHPDRRLRIAQLVARVVAGHLRLTNRRPVGQA
jgi:alpha/beta superfamily hydrolase